MVTFGAWWWATTEADTTTAEPVSPVMHSADSMAPDVVIVHVSGAVQRPGVVRLLAGARAIDAIEAAGGAVPGAALDGVNLAAEVVDGSQIRVPRIGDQMGGGAVADDGVVVVNQADAGELEALPGVGPVLAQRIVDHRDRHGPYRTPEDLLDVSGIGESILARLRAHIRVP